MRKELSGAQLTSSEKAYYNSIAPDSGTDPRLVMEYMERMSSISKVARNRRQALDEAGAKWDEKAGAVRRFNGELVPDTGSVLPMGKTAPAAAPTAAPASSVQPRVAPADQRARDGEAKSVLESELVKAQERAQQIPQEMAAEKNPQKVLALQAEMSRNEQDIASIQREIGRLPGQKASALPRSNLQKPKTIKWGDLP
jgi:hypothetical protein